MVGPSTVLGEHALRVSDKSSSVASPAHQPPFVGLCRWGTTMVWVAAMGLSGCATVYWDPGWQYAGIEKGEQQNQALNITSTPAATVELNGKEIGSTPLTYSFPYGRSVVKATRSQYRKSAGRSPVVIQSETRTDMVVQRSSYVLRFRAPAHHDKLVVVDVPTDSRTIDVALVEAGSVTQIDCMLNIDTREEYFAEIKKVIARYATRGPNHPAGAEAYKCTELEQQQGQNVYRSVCTLTVRDLAAFDELAGTLRAEAKRNDFVFEIIDVKAEATFSTNVMDSAIEHVVRGRVRDGSVLLLYQKGRFIDVSSFIEAGGRFAFSIRMSPGESKLYLVSKYLEIPVYKMIDVFSQKESEHPEKQFAEALGLTPDVLRGMIGIKQPCAAPAAPPSAPRRILEGEGAASTQSEIGGRLQIVVRPADQAHVVIDGTDRGRAPLLLTLKPGTYTVELRHPDYHPLPRKVTVQANETTVLAVDLQIAGVPVRK